MWFPAWEGGQDGRHAGWKPALLKEARDALRSIVICSNVSDVAAGREGLKEIRASPKPARICEAGSGDIAALVVIGQVEALLFTLFADASPSG